MRKLPAYLVPMLAPIAAHAAPPVLTCPSLDHPITVATGDGETKTKMDPTKDYIVRLPDHTKQGSTMLQGGHNVCVIGGEISVPAGDTQQRALYINGATGTVHIEGVHFAMEGGAESDAIQIAAPLATVQLYKLRIDGVHGFMKVPEHWHADLIQPWGGVKALRMALITGTSAYQGLQFSQLHGPIGSISISYVDFRGLGVQIPTSDPTGGNGGYLYWRECTFTGAASYDHFYVQGRAGRSFARTLWPDASTDCPARIAANGMSATFPMFPGERGKVRFGTPNGGDYVPAGSVGLGYVAR